MSVEPRAFPVIAYPRGARGVAVLLRGVAVGAVLVLALLLVREVFAGDLVMPPLRAAVLLCGWALLPEVLVRLLGWLYAGTLEHRPESYHLTTRRWRYDLPAGSVRVSPWRLPVPMPGASLRTTAGRVFALGLPDLEAAAARDGGETESELVAPGSRWAAFTLARAAARPSRLGRRLLAFGVFPLLPALVVFRVDQVITYGAWNGQYLLQGLAPYLGTLARRLVETLAQLILYAGVWRALAEPLVLAMTLAVPTRATPLRRAAELTLLALYFAGIPALILWRILS